MSEKTIVTVAAVLTELETGNATTGANPITTNMALAQEQYMWLSTSVLTAESLGDSSRTAVEQRATYVMSIHAGWSEKLDAADPYLIAAAEALGAAVVSSETRTGATRNLDRPSTGINQYPKRAKIPDVCDELGVQHFNLVEFFSHVGWRY